MSVAFDDAMATLEAMFSGMDREVLSTVLHSTGGHMERAVEVLLQLADSAPPPAAPSGGAQPTPGAATSTPTPMPASTMARPRRQSFRERPHRAVLPDDFLRPPSWTPQRVDASGRGRSNDDLLTEMLQDEMYLAQLQRMPEFSRYLDEERRVLAEARANPHPSTLPPPRRPLPHSRATKTAVVATAIRKRKKNGRKRGGEGETDRRRDREGLQHCVGVRW